MSKKAPDWIYFEAAGGPGEILCIHQKITVKEGWSTHWYILKGQITLQIHGINLDLFYK